MNSRTFKPLLADAVDTLLSLQTTPARHAIALSQLEAVVAPLALDPHPNLLHAFLKSQDSIERNVTSGLLEWLGRTLIRLEVFKGSDADKVRENMARCLGLIQGLLLLHRSSQRLFSRKSSLEYLVAVVELARSSNSATATTPLASPQPSPLPSPVLFPTSPAFHHQSDPFHTPRSDAAKSDAAQRLAIAALDTLLCALVDRPKNLRAFEESGGLESIVKTLKDRSVAQPVRIKIIEILYYYLLPETNLGASTSTTPSSTYSAASFVSSVETMSSLSSTTFTNPELPNMLANAANDFVPQTPTKPKPPSSHQRSSSLAEWNRGTSIDDPVPSTSSQLPSRDPSPSRTPQKPRGLRHKRSQSLLSFPTQPTSTPTSPRALSHSVSAPSSDSESTPRPRFVRSSRNPLQPIPGSPDLSRPRASHRRSQSTSAASLAASPHLPSYPSRSRPSPRIPTAKREERETAMLPPPVPLSRSTSTRLPPPSHRRTSSSSSSTSSSSRHVPLARSSSLTTPITTPRTSSRSNPPRSTTTQHQHLEPPPSPTLSSHGQTSLPIPGRTSSRQQLHVRSEAEKKELLRKIIPNVEALEQRFKMMGFQ